MMRQNAICMYVQRGLLLIKTCSFIHILTVLILQIHTVSIPTQVCVYRTYSYNKRKIFRFAFIVHIQRFMRKLRTK